MDQRFEVAEVLLTVGETATDEGDVVAFLQLEVWACTPAKPSMARRRVNNGRMWMCWMKGKRMTETTSLGRRWNGRGWVKVWIFRPPAKGNVPRRVAD